MAYLAYIPLIIFFILLQTVVLPVLFLVNNSYDLFLVLVLFLGFHRPYSEGVPLVIIMGVLSDSFSGGPFGLFTTSYIWLYVGVRVMVQYFLADSWFVLILAVFTGVFFEHLIVWLSLVMGQYKLHVTPESMRIAANQMIWAMLTGPFIFHAVKVFFSKWDSWFRMRFRSSFNSTGFER